MLDYNHFKKVYKMTAIDIINKHAPDVNPKAIQLINFTGNLTCNGNRVMLFITEESEETILQDCFHFSQETVKLL